MRRMPFALAVLLAAITIEFAGASAPALPKDSVYQLPVQLTDQSGKTWAWSARRGRPQIVAMFYTSCQYICPLIVDSGKAIERTLTPGERASIGILLVSMDPDRDTPKALAAVVKERGLDTRQWTLASPAPSWCATSRMYWGAIPQAGRRRVQPHQRVDPAGCGRSRGGADRAGREPSGSRVPMGGKQAGTLGNGFREASRRLSPACHPPCTDVRLCGSLAPCPSPGW